MCTQYRLEPLKGRYHSEDRRIILKRIMATLAGRVWALGPVPTSTWKMASACVGRGGTATVSHQGISPIPLALERADFVFPAPPLPRSS
jgi:hypothetical protein